MSPANRQPRSCSQAVGDNLNVIQEAEEDDPVVAKEAAPAAAADLLQSRSRPPPPPNLYKRTESSMSIQSSCSVDSDWSDEDEELEELERMLDDIQVPTYVALRTELSEERQRERESILDCYC